MRSSLSIFYSHYFLWAFHFFLFCFILMEIFISRFHISFVYFVESIPSCTSCNLVLILEIVVISITFFSAFSQFLFHTSFCAHFSFAFVNYWFVMFFHNFMPCLTIYDSCWSVVLQCLLVEGWVLGVFISWRFLILYFLLKVTLCGCWLLSPVHFQDFWIFLDGPDVSTDRVEGFEWLTSFLVQESPLQLVQWNTISLTKRLCGIREDD